MGTYNRRPCSYTGLLEVPESITVCFAKVKTLAPEKGIVEHATAHFKSA